MIANNNGTKTKAAGVNSLRVPPRNAQGLKTNNAANTPTTRKGRPQGGCARCGGKKNQNTNKQSK
jgi:hypothetical protein